MNEIEQLNLDFQQLAACWPGRGKLAAFPAKRLVHLSITCRTFGSAPEIENALATEGYETTHSGWIRRQSDASICPSAIGETERRGFGVPLAGEWVVRDHVPTSAKLWRDGGSWRLTRISEFGEPGETTVSCLRENVVVMAHGAGSGVGRLLYAVYWGAAALPEDHALAGGRTGRFFARFTGFEEVGE